MQATKRNVSWLSASLFIIAIALVSQFSPATLFINGKEQPLEDIRHAVSEIETHLHSGERWFGAAASPSGTTHVADRLAVGIVDQQVNAGNDTWGAWTLLLGSSDTPTTTGKTHFDFRKITISTTQRKGVEHWIQIFCGDTAPIGDPTDNNYTEDTFISAANSSLATKVPLVVQDARCAAGAKVWMRTHVPGQNEGTIDFKFGIHEYDE